MLAFILAASLAALPAFLAGDAAGDAVPHANSRSRPSGLWIGRLQLCGGRVIAVETGEPELEGGRSSLTLRFSDDFAGRVRALTARHVGRPLPVILDGRVIVSPIVNEPIGKAVSIVPADGLPLDRIRAAVALPC